MSTSDGKQLLRLATAGSVDDGKSTLIGRMLYDAKLLFDDTDLDYGGGADSGATYFAGSTRYRPPQVLLDMATAPRPGVVRERHGIFVDGSAPVVEGPEAPFGRDFDDPANTRQTTARSHAMISKIFDGIVSWKICSGASGTSRSISSSTASSTSTGEVNRCPPCTTR